MPNCIGMMDGTHFPLAFKPRVDPASYFTRKKEYAIHALIVCDHNSHIHHITTGWPGSIHDNRVWQNCDLLHNFRKYFGKREYILGDSAFTSSFIMVASYKKQKGIPLSMSKTWFNTYLVKSRIKTEHCIGLLKNKFQILKGIRNKLETKKDMCEVLHLIYTCVILHNLLIEDNVPKTWYIYEDDEEEEEEDNVVDCEANVRDLMNGKENEYRRSYLHALLLDTITI